MGHVSVDDLRFHYEFSGAGEPVVLVHGSWDDLRGWDALVPHLAGRFRVLGYDRRGHGGSDRPPGQGRMSEDVADLAALLERLEHAPAHVVGHSYGATIALSLAADRPELCRSLVVHEPPLFALLAGTDAQPLFDEVRRRMGRVVELLEAGEDERATELFVDEVGFGPGTWEQVLDSVQRRTFVTHADTWLDQARDPDRLALGIDRLGGIRVPTLITRGDLGLPWYGPVMEILTRSIPGVRSRTIAGCGHAPHLTQPERFASAIAEAAIRSAATPG
ncbi:alpha/beta fold hydrolase [Saccharopolyspora sp. 5N102]|uniref:alpha/beta fold hydrolase n=1 Tax=Saccharopolyspora sp. 5N102 TaxID=3375155 RepID=UPI00379DD4AB